jgi:hypothetical protein
MSTVQYTLQNANDYIVVNGETSTYPDITLSDTTTFDFYLKEDGLSVDLKGGGSAGATAGGPAGGTAGGPAGFTAAGLGKTVSDTAQDSYNRLKEYQKYAGYSSQGSTFGGSYVSENPEEFDRAPIDGLIIAVVPGDGVDQARGVWGVITGIEDDTEIYGAVARISVDLFVLAEFDEYGNEENVREAFASDF